MKSTNPNQLVYEIARDIITMLTDMKSGETANITIVKKDYGLYDFSWDKGIVWCYSEVAEKVANELRKAYCKTIEKQNEK